MKVFVRPDGRRFVRDPDAQSLARTSGDVYCSVDESEVEEYVTLGFATHRREGEYVLPTIAPRSNPPPGVRLARADEVDADDLRRLDDALRQDVPGTDGWQWDATDFRAETFESPHFDPATYLVAVDEASGALGGIVRVWMRPDGPKLGFIGVRRPYRGCGLARCLVGAVFEELRRRGVAEMTTTIDETNVASRGLLEGLGARRVGTTVELIRRG